MVGLMQNIFFSKGEKFSQYTNVVAETVEIL